MLSKRCRRQLVDSTELHDSVLDLCAGTEEGMARTTRGHPCRPKYDSDTACEFITYSGSFSRTSNSCYKPANG